MRQAFGKKQSGAAAKVAAKAEERMNEARGVVRSWVGPRASDAEVDQLARGLLARG